MPQEKNRPTFAPLDPFPGEENLLSPQAQRRWLLALMIVGLVLRLTRYLLRFPLWEDEAMLSANLLDRGYGGLLQPLHYCQVAPTLFLWGQLTAVKLLGFNEYALRLIPFLCGMGSLLLFRRVAGRLLQGTALLLAVGLFAVAYPMTRYAAEAKPYGCDLLVGLAMLALVIQWLRRPNQTRWLWYLAMLVGPAVGYSFPAIFVAGGVSLIVAWVLVMSRRTKGAGHEGPAALADGTGTVPATLANGARSVPRTSAWIPWMVYNMLLVAGFAVLLVVSKYSVGETNQQTMEETHWANMFPPITQPLKLPLWLLEIHAGAMLGYPVGGPNWGSTFSLICVLVGVAALVRRRQWLLLGLLLAPLGLNFVAAALHRFPYGGHARMTLFLAPTFCTLIAVGLTAGLAWIEARRRIPASAMAMRWFVPLNGCTMVLGLLALLGAGSWLRDVSQPYKSATTLRAREFAQWFWFEMSHDSELVSCETDLKTDLSPDKLNCGWSSLYFCNQRIYSPRHARGEQPQLGRVSVDRPLRCVLYRSPKEEQESPPPDPQVRQRWLEKMQADYDLVGHDSYPFAAYDKSDRRKISDDYVEVFKFVPKGGSGAALTAAKAGQMQR
ncbi:MAG: ArnT family glycosyltransferase [Thermoguttaceae bacterium]